MSFDNTTGLTQKHVANFSGTSTVSGELTIEGSIISNGSEIVLPTTQGAPGEFMTTDGNGNTSWASIPSAPVNLNGLSDVTIASAGTGQVLTYTGSQWENKAEKKPTLIYTTDTTLVLNDTHYYVGCTTTNPLTITLPDVATNSGKVYIIHKLGASGTITINTSGSDNLDTGGTSISISTQYERIELFSNGYASDPLWITI